MPYSLAYFSSIHLDNPVGSLPSFGVRDIQIPTIPSELHNWTLNPFHMMGVAGILGGALLSPSMVLQWRTHCTKMVNKQTPSKHSTQLKRKRLIQWLQQTVSGLRSSVLRLVIRGEAFISLCCLSLLWVSGLLPSVLLVLTSQS